MTCVGTVLVDSVLRWRKTLTQKASPPAVRFSVCECRITQASPLSKSGANRQREAAGKGCVWPFFFSGLEILPELWPMLSAD